MTKHLHTAAPPASRPPMASLPPAGSGQFDTIDAGKLIGKAVADALAQELPPLLADAVVKALIPVLAQAAQPHMCAACLARRIGWEKTNQAAVQAAMDAAQSAVARGEAGTVDFAPHLPERLRAAGIPAVNQAITAEQGTSKCAGHITGIPGGAAPLLVATANVPPGGLAGTP